MNKEFILNKELRHGNWITINGIPYTANGLLLAELEKGNCTWKKTVTPIELTSKILEVCGFVAVTGKDRVYDKDRLRLFGPLAYLKEEDSDNCHYLPHNVHFLHQLQNLYFALYGRELSIDGQELERSVATDAASSTKADNQK